MGYAWIGEFASRWTQTGVVLNYLCTKFFELTHWVQIGGGYVVPDLKFMVTNQLEIFSSSSLKALITLERIRTERVGDLATKEVTVVAAEVLAITTC